MKVSEQIPFFPPISVKPCWNASCKAGSYPAPAFQTHISQSPGRLPAHSPDGGTVHKYDIPALRPSAPPFQPAHRPRGVPAPTNRTRQSGTGVSGIPRACSNQKKFRQHPQRDAGSNGSSWENSRMMRRSVSAMSHGRARWRRTTRSRNVSSAVFRVCNKVKAR